MRIGGLGGSVLAAAVLLVASAHIGSPDTWFAGDAGPYRVLVHVRAPGVIPGVAEVNVEVEGDPPTEVLVHVNRFDSPTAPPPPDVAEPVRGRTNLYRANLWVMTSGSNSVTVQVRGARGEGTVVVPTTIVAFRRLDLSGPLAMALGAAGVFLFVGLVNIIGAAVRESVLPPGAAPDGKRRLKAIFAMAGMSLALVLVIWGTERWWDYEDGLYRAAMFRPLGAVAEVAEGADGAAIGRSLRLSIVDSTWKASSGAAARTFSPLVPDHGKLMHLFAVREDLGALAHLHPETTDTVAFVAALPPLPAGRYRIFGDVTHESGFSQTLTAAVDIADGVGGDTPAGSGAQTGPGAQVGSGSLGDDSWFDGLPAERGEAALEDGVRMRWNGAGEEVFAGVPAPLRFEVVEADGSPAALEPYMGMDGHAVVLREDGGVFIHLHPMGTVSAASQLSFELRAPTDTLAGMLAPRVAAADAERAGHALHAGTSSVLSFPYAFPSAGRYRVWVQVKHQGRVLTGAFPVEVRATLP